MLNLFDDLLKTIFDNNNNNNESVNDNESVNNYDSDDEEYYKIKQINNWFKTIDKTKSFEEQIEILKTKDFLDEYWHDDYHNDKELNTKIFKTKSCISCKWC